MAINQLSFAKETSKVANYRYKLTVKNQE